MANKAPGFMWYPKDCDTDENVRGMDDRQFGFYIRCLNHSWLNDGLPGVLDELARVIGRSGAYVRKLWPRVGKCFELRESRYVNPKQEEQRANVREYIESRKKGAEARWKDKHVQSTSTCITDAHAMHVEDMRVGSGNGSKGSVSKVPEKSRFGEWLDGYRGRKADPDSACRAWLSVDADKQADAAFACRDRYNQSAEVKRGDALMEASNFIFQQARNKWAGDWPKAQEEKAQKAKVYRVAEPGAYQGPMIDGMTADEYMRKLQESGDASIR